MPDEGIDGDLVTPGGIAVRSESLSWRFSRSPGAGGQHVNTSDTRVELVCELEQAGLPDGVRERLIAALGTRVRVAASDERSQLRNRQLARSRLAALLDRAAYVRKPRRPTRPRRGAVESRLEDKRRQAERKASRRPDPDDRS